VLLLAARHLLPLLLAVGLASVLAVSCLLVISTGSSRQVTLEPPLTAPITWLLGSPPRMHCFISCTRLVLLCVFLSLCHLLPLPPLVLLLLLMWDMLVSCRAHVASKLTETGW